MLVLPLPHACLFHDSVLRAHLNTDMFFIVWFPSLLSHDGFSDVMGDFSWGGVNQCLLTPDSKPRTDQSNGSSRVLRSEMMSLLGLLTNVWVKGCF